MGTAPPPVDVQYCNTEFNFITALENRCVNLTARADR